MTASTEIKAPSLNAAFLSTLAVRNVQRALYLNLLFNGHNSGDLH
jgi:hypothetical protein